MHTSPLSIYAYESNKKTPVKTESSDTVTKYYYEIKKNKNEECLAVNIVNFIKNEESSYLIIESKSKTNISTGLIVCFCIFFVILFVVLIFCIIRCISKKQKSKIEDCTYTSTNMKIMPEGNTNNEEYGGEKPYYMT